jgi:hypothetical protein
VGRMLGYVRWGLSRTCWLILIYQIALIAAAWNSPRICKEKRRIKHLDPYYPGGSIACLVVYGPKKK